MRELHMLFEVCHNHLFFFFLVLEYSCFTMLSEFLLYNDVNQLCVYMYIPSLMNLPPTSPHLAHPGHQSTTPSSLCLQQLPTSYPFYTQQCPDISPNLPIHSTHTLCVHTSISYICVSITALKMGSSVPLFQIPHTCINIWYLFFSF